MNKFITIYDKYIFKQILFTTFVAILLFTVVWIAPEMLLKVIKHILTHEITAKTGLLILICEVPKILGKAFPVGLLLGSLFTFDKLSKDSELTIFRAVGMSFAQIMKPVLVLSAIITVLCFITYDKLIPWSCQKLIDIKGEGTVTQYIYTRKDENNNLRESVIVSKFQREVMEHIIIIDFDEHIFNDLHGIENVMVAETGKKGFTKEGEPCWIMNDIISYDINENGIFSNVRHIKTKNILVGEAADNAYTIMINATKRDREINNRDLKAYVKLLKDESLDEEYRLYYNKYLQRFLHPLVCILLAVLGCLLGFSKPREQRLIGFTIAIACIFAYYITLPFFDLMAEKGVISPILSASIPPFAFLCAIIAFYKTRDL